MLVADRSELRGEGESDLARHLRECNGCRRLAAGIESDTALLASIVQRSDSTADVVAIPRGRRVWNAILVAALPIAATIVIGVQLQRRQQNVTPPTRDVVAPEQIAINSVSVDVEPGQTATVIRTRDPKVTIVWISPGGTQ
jgi:hypothetical protein